MSTRDCYILKCLFVKNIADKKTFFFGDTGYCRDYITSDELSYQPELAGSYCRICWL
ncbi:hypothetical protein XBFFL1_2490025 [Xenorhabdus bovienii str. feltiae Florida]|nr:hypothetical protein XBFFR1_560025 [Xenorhabdus bovienii str. feltiae France]CDG93305.1 hypothetical protein XBFFL1_2490025 [Xenorhabdus bovienii str. feltiae Florida]